VAIEPRGWQKPPPRPIGFNVGIKDAFQSSSSLSSCTISISPSISFAGCAIFTTSNNRNYEYETLMRNCMKSLQYCLVKGDVVLYGTCFGCSKGVARVGLGGGLGLPLGSMATPNFFLLFFFFLKKYYF
jgi:hypothetical protein